MFLCKSTFIRSMNFYVNTRRKGLIKFRDQLEKKKKSSIVKVELTPSSNSPPPKMGGNVEKMTIFTEF